MNATNFVMDDKNSQGREVVEYRGGKEMKRFLLVMVFLAIWVLISAESAMAEGINIWATVNPNWNNSWDKDSKTGTALYTIGVDPGSYYGADKFDVTFEDDIFALVGNVIDNTAGLISPLGWTMYSSEYSGGCQYQVAMSDSDVLEPGESPPVSFWVDYTLRSADQYNVASGYDVLSGLEWEWDQHGPWQQAVSAINISEIISSNMSVFPTGGGVTHHTPEPATMFLLGSGLVGLGWIGRRKIKKGSKC